MMRTEFIADRAQGYPLHTAHARAHVDSSDEKKEPAVEIKSSKDRNCTRNVSVRLLSCPIGNPNIARGLPRL